MHHSKMNILNFLLFVHSADLPIKVINNINIPNLVDLITVKEVTNMHAEQKELEQKSCMLQNFQNYINE